MTTLQQLVQSAQSVEKPQGPARPTTIAVEQCENGYVLRIHTPQLMTTWVERSVEQLLDRIRSVLNEQFVPQDGG